MQLKDRVAIVTGAARGIGQEYCLALAREGAKIVAADILPCQDTVTMVREQAGGEAIGVQTDVSSAASTQAMADAANAKWGRIDVLVNNAALYGGIKLTPFDAITEADWDRMMAINVKGVWLCCKAVIPTMKRLGKGKIVNISSGTIWRGGAGLLHYVTSKGGVWAFTRALSRELSGTGININTVTPGFVETDASRSLNPEHFEEANRRTIESRVVRRGQQPSDLTGVVVFLSSDASDFIAGQTINCDGGAGFH